MRIRYLLPVLAISLSVLAACGPKANDTKSSSDSGKGGGANGYVGNVATSGLYAATWSAGPDAEVAPFNGYGALTLVSDKQSFGNLHVEPDGSVSFGSTDPGFGNNLSFAGSGAKVTLDKSGRFVCAFTIDSDLKGTRDSSIVHLKGGITVHWHPGISDLSCP